MQFYAKPLVVNARQVRYVETFPFVHARSTTTQVLQTLMPHIVRRPGTSPVSNMGLPEALMWATIKFTDGSAIRTLTDQGYFLRRSPSARKRWRVVLEILDNRVPNVNDVRMQRAKDTAVTWQLISQHDWFVEYKDDTPAVFTPGSFERKFTLLSDEPEPGPAPAPVVHTPSSLVATPSLEVDRATYDTLIELIQSCPISNTSILDLSAKLETLQPLIK